MTDTPSTGMIKALWLDPTPWANPEQAASDFDAWLRKVKAEAWGEGQNDYFVGRHENPYL